MGTIRLNGLLTVAVIAATLVPASPAQAVDSPCWSARRAETSLTAKINSARSSQNLGKLQLDPELSRAARIHTRAMANQDYLFHTPSDRLRRRVTNWITLGENVGVGATVDSLHRAFMNSPAHRDNVLYGSYRHVGIGTSVRDGRLWVTVIFEGLTDPGTPLNMPSC